MTVRLTALFLCVCLPSTLFAQSAWVTDEFEITLRTGPSTGNAIERMLSSGTELSVLERDADSGYTRVQTRAGTEGWVLTRYLMSEPSAREQLESLSSQLNSATAEGSSLNSQLDGIRSEYDAASRQIETLTREKEQVEAELAEIRRTAADVLSINELNTALQSRLATAESRIGSLEQENAELKNDALRMWFLTGAGVLLFGMLLGLWLPKLRGQRRSRYDRF